jgi:hypothetical protein
VPQESRLARVLPVNGDLISVHSPGRGLIVYSRFGVPEAAATATAAIGACMAVFQTRIASGAIF